MAPNTNQSNNDALTVEINHINLSVDELKKDVKEIKESLSLKVNGMDQRITLLEKDFSIIKWITALVVGAITTSGMGAITYLIITKLIN